jgi:hypothetical protein
MNRDVKRSLSYEFKKSKLTRDVSKYEGVGQRYV